jgi:hypothetical protein
MSMKFYVRASDNAYLGGFLGCEPDVPAVEVPEKPEGSYAWTGTAWEAVAPPPPSKEEQEQKRAEAYKNEADPLFFKYQRGEATEQEWLGKIEEIRARYPYPEDE